MTSKRIKRKIRQSKKFYEKFIEDNLTGVPIPNFTKDSSGSKNTYSSSLAYSEETEMGTEIWSESYSLKFKKSGKVDYITLAYYDTTSSTELGNIFAKIKLKNFRKFVKAWEKRIEESYVIQEEDGDPHLSSPAEANGLVNWMDDLPGTQNGKRSSFISFYSGEDHYFA